MKSFLSVLVSLVLLFTTGTALAYVASSPNYKLEKDSLNFGGNDSSASTNFVNIGTLGEIVSGLSGGTNYNASSGYRYLNLDPTSVPPTVVLGCTDSVATNYNSLATQDDGSCVYPPGPGGNTSGCTDPLALNYNPSAIIDDGTCYYGVPNVQNFEANYHSNNEAIRLTWKNPVAYNLKSVIIVRQEGIIPLTPSSGLLVYDGKGESAWDLNVRPGVRYYYTAFVQSQDDRYSSGVVTSELFSLAVSGCTNPQALNYNPQATVDDGSCLPGGEGVPGCRDIKALNYNPQATIDNGSCVYSPFSASSTKEEIIPDGSKDWNFLFIQPQERTKTFDNQMKVKILGHKDLTILFNYNLAPATLKTIGVTLTDPVDETKSFSFLMHRSANGQAYEATISPLIRQGTYPVNIYIINYDNQAVQRIKGRLIVSGEGLFLEILESNALPIAATTGLAIGFLPSLYDLLIVLFRIFSYFFGRRRNDNPWGTVYDSVTKRPLDPVYLTVEQDKKELSTAITDIDGRFSFFLPAGTYTIKANKTHYRFPSAQLAGKTTDELYTNLYFGDQLTTNGQAVININIPMDPIDFDWNEFAKTKKNFFEFYNRRQLWLHRLYRLIFSTGFIFSLLVSALSPSWWNFVIIVLYFGLVVLNRYWRPKSKPWQVINQKTGEPLPFAIVRIFLPDLNQQIKYTVADQFGRFYLLVRPGVYYYTVEEKQTDGTYLKVSHSKPQNLPKGVLTGNLYV